MHLFAAHVHGDQFLPPCILFSHCYHHCHCSDLLLLCLVWSFLTDNIFADGLRGIAALSVLNLHTSFLFLDGRIRDAWGQEDVSGRSIVQWPFIRLLLSGTAPVCIFFIISGYALSYKPLKLAHQGKYAEFGSALSSLIFRRHTRLYIPALVVAFAPMIMSWFGLFGQGDGEPWFPTRQAPLGATFYDHISLWLYHMARFIDPFPGEGQNHSNPYEGHMWTLPPEFSASMFIFTCLAAFSRFRPQYRLALNVLIVVYAHYLARWVMFLFAYGMFLCDLRLRLDNARSQAILQPDDKGPSGPTALLGHESPAAPQGRNVGRKIVLTVSLIVSLFLLSYPDYNLWNRPHVDVPGFITLETWVPKRYDQYDKFWINIGAVMFVSIVDYVPALQSIFTMIVPQYLGKISYSMYLTHGSVIWSVGRLYKMIGVSLMGGVESPSASVGVTISMVFNYITVFIIGDLTTQHVDKRAVDFGRWFYDRLSADPRLELESGRHQA